MRVNSEEGNCMRILLMGPCLATSIGCSCLIPPQAMPKACTSKGCFYRSAVSSSIELKPASFKPDPGQSAKKAPIATKMDVPASAQRSGISDPVLNKATTAVVARSEEHTSELQSLTNLVCRLLLEKKKKKHLYEHSNL